MIQIIGDIIPNKQYQYDMYLSEHIGNVRKSWDLIKDKIDDSELVNEVTALVINHDKSKYGEEEYEPYLEYFYGDKDEDAFNVAWNHHQKNNPHHWQYWLLREDEGKDIALDIPDKYILEMLCDWNSFVLKNMDYTIMDWYTENKKKIVLSSETKKKLESYIKLFDGVVELGGEDDD